MSVRIAGLGEYRLDAHEREGIAARRDVYADIGRLLVNKTIVGERVFPLVTQPDLRYALVVGMLRHTYTGNFASLYVDPISHQRLRTGRGNKRALRAHGWTSAQWTYTSEWHSTPYTICAVPWFADILEDKRLAAEADGWEVVV